MCYLSPAERWSHNSWLRLRAEIKDGHAELRLEDKGWVTVYELRCKWVEKDKNKLTKSFQKNVFKIKLKLDLCKCKMIKVVVEVEYQSNGSQETPSNLTSSLQRSHEACANKLCFSSWWARLLELSNP